MTVSKDRFWVDVNFNYCRTNGLEPQGQHTLSTLTKQSPYVLANGIIYANQNLTKTIRFYRAIRRSINISSKPLNVLNFHPSSLQFARRLVVPLRLYQPGQIFLLEVISHHYPLRCCHFHDGYLGLSGDFLSSVICQHLRLQRRQKKDLPMIEHHQSIPSYIQ